MKNQFLLIISLLMIILNSCNNMDNEIKKIVAFGDSTTSDEYIVENVYSKNLSFLFADSGLNIEIINSGISGNTTEDALLRFNEDVLEHEPDLVIIQFGINDSYVDNFEGNTKPFIPISRYRENLEYFINNLKEKNIKIILMTPNPLRWTDELKLICGQEPFNINDPKGLNLYVEKFAQVVRDVAKKQGITFVDIYNIFENSESNNKVKVCDLLLDGIHPNEKAHKIIADSLFKTIIALNKSNIK